MDEKTRGSVWNSVSVFDICFHLYVCFQLPAKKCMPLLSGEIFILAPKMGRMAEEHISSFSVCLFGGSLSDVN